MIATILVVIGHCTYVRILTDYGGCDYSAFFNNKNIISRLLVKQTNFIYVFHMPLFMGLSGALFYRSILAGNYKSLKQVIVCKWKRLMVPFLAVTVFYSVPLKYISGYYQYSENILRDIIVGQLFLQGNSHLWYCVALFNIFIIAFVLETKIKIPVSFRSMFLLAIYLGSFGIHINVIKDTLQYLIWFYMGYGFEPNREFINSKVKNSSILKQMVLFGFFYIAYHFLKRSELLFVEIVCRLFKVFITLIACLIVYEIAYITSRAIVRWNRLCYMILSDSFGIYLYSDTWNYVILSVVTALLGDNILQNRLEILPLYILRFFWTLGISILITETIRRLSHTCDVHEGKVAETNEN